MGVVEVEAVDGGVERARVDVGRVGAGRERVVGVVGLLGAWVNLGERR
jgi:hypothetical protein